MTDNSNKPTPQDKWNNRARERSKAANEIQLAREKRKQKERERAIQHQESLGFGNGEPLPEPKAWVGMDTTGLVYAEGVTAPTLKHNNGWVLEEIMQRKDDNVILKHTLTYLSTNQVSKIRIHYAKPVDLYNFRRGKPLAIEFNDATATMKLTRLQGGPLTKVVTSADEAIEAMKDNEKPL